MAQAQYWLNRSLHFITHLSHTDYMILAACAVLVGFVCMRGFGSRLY